MASMFEEAAPLNILVAVIGVVIGGVGVRALSSLQRGKTRPRSSGSFDSKPPSP